MSLLKVWMNLVSLSQSPANDRKITFCDNPLNDWFPISREIEWQIDCISWFNYLFFTSSRNRAFAIKENTAKGKACLSAPEDKICSLFMTKSNFLLNTLTDIAPNPLMSFDIQSSVMIYCWEERKVGQMDWVLLWWTKVWSMTLRHATNSFN